MIVFDYSDFLRKADELSAAADQVPYALARALNQSAEDAQTVLIVSTWQSR
jgi:Flp pilus assembly protein TadG